jgi:DNA-binding NarL/FixJ family response regulator
MPKVTWKDQWILTKIADGLTYEEIMRAEPMVSRKDIRAAARNILLASGSRLYRANQRHPGKPVRAFQKWDPSEEEALLYMHGAGLPAQEIAKRLFRDVSAVEHRLSRIVDRTRR